MARTQKETNQGAFAFADEPATATGSASRGISFPPTAEQETIVGGVDKMYAGDTMVIRAFAGSGKTATLQLIANKVLALQYGRGIYLAFNREIAKEAGKKFKAFNVESRTFHSLAFRAVVQGGIPCSALNLRSIHSTVSPTAFADLKRATGLPDTKALALVLKTVNSFCNGDAPVITEDVAAEAIVAQFGDPMTGSTRQRKRRTMMLSAASQLATAADTVWKEIRNIRMHGRTYHSVYLKVFEQDESAIQRAFAQFRSVYVDEAQDLSGVQTSIIKKLMSRKVHAAILVGDEHQQIYGWRGAVNALDVFKTPHQYKLTQSFRFTPDIADAANRVLERLPNSKGNLSKVKGAGPAKSVTGEAVLARTNIGVLTAALHSTGKPVFFPGGMDHLIDMFEDALKLKAGHLSEIRTEEFQQYSDWYEFIEEAEATGNPSMKTIAKMVQDGEWAAPLEALKQNISDKEGPGVLTIGTTHKLKGREYEKVTVWEDFPDLEVVTSNYDKAKANGDQVGMAGAVEEFNLFYVALTRATTRVNLPIWAKGFLGMYEKEKTMAATAQISESLDGKYLARGHSESSIPVLK